MPLKRKLKKRTSKKNFKKTFKEELRYGIAAAVGFSIAYAWREPLLLFFDDVVVTITRNTFPYLVQTSSALIITVLGVGLLWVASRYLR